MKNLLLTISIFVSTHIFAQIPQVNLQLGFEIPFNYAYPALTIEHDQQARDYIYVAAKEQGLLIYDISGTPSKVKTITKNQLDTLDVMSVTQSGNYLYLALGNSFTNPEFPGMAVVDVSNPTNAFITDIYKKYTGTKSGGGIVKVEGNYAYFGAMGNGLIVFDVTDKSNISIAGQYTPSIYFPDANPQAAKYNARGMAVKNSIVYLCYDAGGIRIINCSNKQNIKETGRYSNPAMNNKARAYNNVVFNDTLLYVAVDYAGMEILNVKDTAHISLVSWWNPWGTSNWFTSRGHANEIQFDLNSKLVFMATGKSDINLVSVANPSAPDSVTVYGGVNNGMGTWGLGLYQDKIYAGYIYVPLCIPFCSNWGGVKEITWNIPTSLQENLAHNFSFYPNPSEDKIQLNSSEGNLKINNISGELMLSRSVQKNEALDLSSLASGFYIITFINNEGEIVSTQKLVKN